MTVTYPPEMLPSPDEGEDAEVVVIHPDTGKSSVIWPPPQPKPTDPQQATPSRTQQQ